MPQRKRVQSRAPSDREERRLKRASNEHQASIKRRHFEHCLERRGHGVDKWATNGIGARHDNCRSPPAGNPSPFHERRTEAAGMVRKRCRVDGTSGSGPESRHEGAWMTPARTGRRTTSDTCRTQHRFCPSADGVLMGFRRGIDGSCPIRRRGQDPAVIRVALGARRATGLRQ